MNEQHVPLVRGRKKVRGGWYVEATGDSALDECGRRDSHGAPCGYPVNPKTMTCTKGHK